MFVADLSHDMKTPLTVILANNSILKSNPDLTVGEQLQWIDSTDDSARNILGLVNSMLELSRLDAERSKAKLSRRQDSVDASESVADISSAAQKSVLQMESVALIQRRCEPGVDQRHRKALCLQGVPHRRSGLHHAMCSLPWGRVLN